VNLVNIIALIFSSLLASGVGAFSGAESASLQKAAAFLRVGEYEKAFPPERIGQAEAQYERAARSSENSVDAQLGLARVLIEKGEYSRAAETCRQALAAAPQNADALNLLGEVLELLGQYDAARANFQKALSINPNHLAARLNLGILQREWGENDASRQTLQFFISYYQSRPNLSAEELSLIAQACVYLNRVRDANDLFYEATQRDKTYWQAYIPWGKLFLSKYNVPDAVSVFEDALKINPNAAEAHLGLARCWMSSDFERSRNAAETALSKNPNLIEAHNLLAEMDIAVGDFKTALGKLEKPLQVNPNALTTRSLRAVCFYFLNDDQNFSSEEAKILSVNPRYGELYFQIAEHLSRRYLFKESVEFYRKGLALDSENWNARAGLGTSLSRVGDEAAAKTELEQAFANDPFNKYVGNLLTLFDDYPKYKIHRTPNFSIRIHENDDLVLARYALELASDSHAKIDARYPVKDAPPFTLEIFPEHDDFAVRCFGLPGAQAFLGICFGNVVAMDSPRARAKGDFVWGETLWHELVHVSHLRLTGNRIPRWLAEGIAVYETSTANPFWQMNLDVPLIQALLDNRLLPLKDLDAGFNRPSNPGQVSLSYFQASLVVEFLVKKYGHDTLRATFPHFKSGMETEPIFKKVYGKDLKVLNDEFQAYLKEKYRLDTVDYSFDHRESGADELAKKLAQNPNNPFLNYRLGKYYKEKGDFAKATPLLQKARELFPDYVIHENPYQALAEIYIKTGQKQLAMKELTELTSRNGKELAPLQMLADLCLETKNYPGAIEALKKVIYISPFEPDVHKKLATAYLAQKQYDAAILELQTLLLTEPPDLAGAHCDLADAYLQSGNKSEAKKSALRALEIAPHYERAQEILLACVE
jgi:tetratricopeptide (TPR) repeat protein